VQILTYKFYDFSVFYRLYKPCNYLSTINKQYTKTLQLRLSSHATKHVNRQVH